MTDNSTKTIGVVGGSNSFKRHLFLLALRSIFQEAEEVILEGDLEKLDKLQEGVHVLFSSIKKYEKNEEVDFSFLINERGLVINPGKKELVAFVSADNHHPSKDFLNEIVEKYKIWVEELSFNKELSFVADQRRGKRRAKQNDPNMLFKRQVQLPSTVQMGRRLLKK